jgi:hypothetical protein
MNMNGAYAILLDGGFVIKKLQAAIGRFPTALDVGQLCGHLRAQICSGNPVKGAGAGVPLASCPTSTPDADPLLRIFFYHAKPSRDQLLHPLSQEKLDLGNTAVHDQHLRLIEGLELTPDFAVRLGETVTHGWKLGSKAMRSLLSNQRSIQAQDLVPDIAQKGVDLRIGLDIARLALRNMAGTIVVVTGDSDLVPAFKFARREGLRIGLITLGHGVHRDLKVHADWVLDSPPGLLLAPAAQTPREDAS